MIKLLGVFLVTGGCSMCGWYFSGMFLGRIHLLEEWQQLIQYLYGEIEYSASDMEEILQLMVLRSTYSKAFWENMVQEIKQHRGILFSDIWKENLPDIELWESLKRNEREIIIELGRNVGNLDRETQLHTLDIFQKRISDSLLKARDEYRTQEKLCHVIGITAGIFISILLV